MFVNDMADDWTSEYACGTYVDRARAMRACGLLHLFIISNDHYYCQIIPSAADRCLTGGKCVGRRSISF
jgi:hypothetical protein